MTQQKPCCSGQRRQGQGRHRNSDYNQCFQQVCFAGKSRDGTGVGRNMGLSSLVISFKTEVFLKHACLLIWMNGERENDPQGGRKKDNYKSRF